jgi:flagellar biosynthesis protein
MPDRSVAIRYEQELPAPFIVASGRGDLARRIREIARQSGVAVVERPELAEALIDLDVGTFIPEELYRVIAELLVFVRDVAREET